MSMSEECIHWLMRKAPECSEIVAKERFHGHTIVSRVCASIPDLISDFYTERQLKEDAYLMIDQMRKPYLAGLSTINRAKLGLPPVKLRRAAMNIKYKKLHPNAVVPRKGTAGAAAYDLTAVSAEDDFSCNVVIYHTGLALEIPTGYVGYIFPRSSVYKEDLRMSNCVGVIDSDFRGEILVMFDRRCGHLVRHIHKCYVTGERIAQLVIMPVPDIEFEQAEELSQTERGEKGYGSTGR